MTEEHLKLIHAIDFEFNIDKQTIWIEKKFIYDDKLKVWYEDYNQFNPKVNDDKSLKPSSPLNYRYDFAEVSVEHIKRAIKGRHCHNMITINGISLQAQCWFDLYRRLHNETIESYGGLLKDDRDLKEDK